MIIGAVQSAFATFNHIVTALRHVNAAFHYRTLVPLHCHRLLFIFRHYYRQRRYAIDRLPDTGSCSDGVVNCVMKTRKYYYGYYVVKSNIYETLSILRFIVDAAIAPARYLQH